MTQSGPANPNAPKPSEMPQHSDLKPAAGTGPSADDLTSEHGTTTIADGVVSKIAGIAAREIPGVHELGGGAARAVGALRERLPGVKTDQGQGVKVEVGTRQAAIDIDLIAEYGIPLADLAEDVRQNVIANVERMTSLEVTEVNVSVNDVHVPGEDDPAAEEPRVE